MKTPIIAFCVSLAFSLLFIVMLPISTLLAELLGDSMFSHVFATIFPNYIFAMVSIWVFIKFFQRNIFALPISFALFPIVITFIASIVHSLNLFDLGCSLWVVSISLITTLFFSLPLFVITLILAIFIYARNICKINIFINMINQVR